MTAAEIKAGFPGATDTRIVSAANHNDQLLIVAPRGMDPGNGYGWDAYVTVNDGKTWAAVGTPGADGLRRGLAPVITSAEFAPGPDNDIMYHGGHAAEFELTYAGGGQGNHDVTVALDTADASGVVTQDTASGPGSGASQGGIWQPSGGGYTFTSYASAPSLQVGESPVGGK